MTSRRRLSPQARRQGRLGVFLLFLLLLILFFLAPMFRGIGLAADPAGAPRDEAAIAADRAAVREVVELVAES